MKAKIKNLGPIKDADIEVKPLTVFVGPNNCGKTWTAYSLAALFTEYSWHQYINSYINNKRPESYPILGNAMRQILEEGRTSIDLILFFNENGENYINSLADLAPTWINEFIGSELASFEGLNISVELGEIRDKIKSNIFEKTLERKHAVDSEGNALLNALKEEGQSLLHFYTQDRGIPEDYPRTVIERFISESVFMIIHRAIYRNVIFLPAERTAFMPLVAQAKPLDIGDEKNKIDKPKSKGQSFSHPIQDLMRNAIRIKYNISYNSRLKKARTDNNVRKYIELAGILQKDILDGNVAFSDDNPENMLRDLVFEVTNKDHKKIGLDLPVVSSMVKGLSPLVLFLSYLAEPNDLLVIDEPEMNLHPEAQVKLTELLAMIVNAGLNVWVTTHSPYLVDHLANLIKANDLREQNGVVDKFYLKQTDALISQDKLSIYLFENNTARNILDESGLIDWSTFSKVSEEISQIYLDIMEGTL